MKNVENNALYQFLTSNYFSFFRFRVDHKNMLQSNTICSLLLSMMRFLGLFPYVWKERKHHKNKIIEKVQNRQGNISINSAPRNRKSDFSLDAKNLSNSIYFRLIKEFEGKKYSNWMISQSFQWSVEAATVVVTIIVYNLVQMYRLNSYDIIDSHGFRTLQIATYIF